MPTSAIRRHSRKTAVGVVDPQLLGIVVSEILEYYPSLSGAAREMGVDRKTLRRLANGKAGATLTRGVYEALEREVEWIDEHDEAAWIAERAVWIAERREDGTDEPPDEDYEFDGLAESLQRAVVGDEVRRHLHRYRSWIESELSEYGFKVIEDSTGVVHCRPRDQLGVSYFRSRLDILGSPGDHVSKRRSLNERTKISSQTPRERCVQDAITHIENIILWETELIYFRNEAAKLGWKAGLARYELSLRRAIDPLSNPENPGIERSWAEVMTDERDMARYLKAAFRKELVQLQREADAARATNLAERNE